MKIILAYMALFLTLTACGNGGQGGAGNPEKQPSVAELNTEVLNLHDSAMAKTDVLYAEILDLRDWAKGTKPEYNQADSLRIKEIAKAIGELQAADEAMMDWMQNYEPPAKDRTEQENLGKLQKYKTEIIKVDQLIDQSLKNGRILLEKAKKQ